MKENSVSKNTDMLLFLLRLMWRRHRAFYGVAAAGVLAMVAGTFSLAIFPKLILDALAISEYAAALRWSFLLVFSQFLSQTLKSFTESRKKIIYFQLSTDIKLELGERVLSLRYEEFERFAAREEYELAKKSVERNSVEHMLAAVTQIIAAIISIAGFLFIFGYISWWIWAVLLLALLVDGICEARKMRYEYDNWEAQSVQEIRMIFARERLTSREFAKENRLFSMYGFVTNLATKYINGLAALQNEVAGKTFRALWWSHIIRGVEIICVYAYVAAQCCAGSISVGDFAMISTTLILFSSTISDAVKSIISIGNEGMYISSLHSFLRSGAAGGGKSAPSPDFERIEFKGVSFAYPGSECTALRNIEVAIERGKTYGIVGENGAGKSTFVKLIMGLYRPTGGGIFIDGAALSAVDDSAYSDFFSAVYQDYGMYAYTLRENITMGADHGDDETMLAHLEKLGMRDKILGLPAGLDTALTKDYQDNGVELSIGEQQKIALARAMYKDAPVFILDEPTSALSPDSEYQLYKSFADITKGKTVLYISHRLASCRLCDEILLFHEGEIVERGPHERLMDKKGMYYNLFSTQASHYAEVENE